MEMENFRAFCVSLFGVVDTNKPVYMFKRVHCVSFLGKLRFLFDDSSCNNATRDRLFCVFAFPMSKTQNCDVNIITFHLPFVLNPELSAENWFDRDPPPVKSLRVPVLFDSQDQTLHRSPLVISLSDVGDGEVPALIPSAMFRPTSFDPSCTRLVETCSALLSLCVNWLLPSSWVTLRVV